MKNPISLTRMHVSRATLVQLLGVALLFAAGPAAADLTVELCGKVANHGGQTVVSEGVKTSFAIDTVEGRLTPVPHCFIHGTLAEDSAFIVQLPAAWNGKYVLQMGGGSGGSELAAPLFLLLQGYAHASSNQGRPGPVFEQADTWQELHLIRNHQLSQYAKGLIVQRYGRNPTYSYLYGSSGGAWRSLSQIERYPQAYDGAGLRNPPIDPRHIFFTRSVFDNNYPTIRPKIAQIIRARDLDEDPYLLLTPSEGQALDRLYAGYGTRGAEWSWYKTDGSTIAGNFYAFVLFDTTYFDDFWTKPGYGGHDGEVDGQIIEGLTGSVTAIGTPNAGGWILNFTDAGHPQPASALKGFRVTFTSGALTGSSFHASTNTAAGRINITGLDGALNGIAVGDTYVLSNRDFLAWQKYHRHIVFGCTDTFTADYCQNGKPIHVQRPPNVEQAYTRQKAHLTGNLKKPVVVVAQGWDHLETITMTNDYFNLVRRVLGHRTQALFRAYWNERTVHGNPTATEINRATERDSSWHLAFQIMTNWIENGVEPPEETVVSVSPGTIVFPPTAAERKGLQPVVNATANGLRKIVVPVGSTVQLDGVAGSPIGNIAKYEWDFEGNNSYDCDSDPATPLPDCGGGPFTPGAEVSTPAVVVYSTPGVYLPTVRVHDDTDSPGPEDGLENLAPVIVIVQ